VAAGGAQEGDRFAPAKHAPDRQIVVVHGNRLAVFDVTGDGPNGVALSVHARAWRSV
jgi:hypothetical protein